MSPASATPSPNRRAPSRSSTPTRPAGLYQKIVVSDDAKTLLGGIFVGDAEPYAALRPLLGRELPGEPGAYLSAAGGEAPAGDDLPDDALVCSCNNVSAGTVRDDRARRRTAPSRAPTSAS